MANPEWSRESEGAVQFATTRWSVVLSAAQRSVPAAAQALEILCRTYYYPLYAYVRRQGYDAHEAQDLTQEFFSRFLEKNYLASVDPQKGRFRSFLLASLKHFLGAARLRESAVKRGGRYTFVPLDDTIEERYQLEPETELSLERVYDRRWATTVMEQALNRLREEFSRAGKTAQFQGLEIFLSKEPDEGEYAVVGAALQMTTGAVGVAVHRLRRRYGELVRAEVAETVAHPAEVEEEMRYLVSVLTSA